jgi:hypothetical protein
MSDKPHPGSELRTIPPWDQRPPEIAYLLNPAFCVLLLNESVCDYQKIKSSNVGMPYPLIFLVLPIVLHKKTREALPHKLSVDLHDWLQENPIVYSGYSDRVKRMVPLTKEAIIFGMQRKVLSFSSSGCLASKLSLPSTANDSNSSLVLHLVIARLVGRWFAKTGSVETIYRMWRIRP